MTVPVLLCADRVAEPPPAPSDDEAEVRVVPALCHDAGAIEALAGGHDRLVLGLCAGQYSLGAIQTRVRSAGVDPLGVQILELSDVPHPDAAMLGTAITGAAARARTFPGSRPEHAKMRLAGVMSRRALLTLSAIEYLAAPSIDHEACAASNGCRACVAVCPQAALTWSDGRIAFDISACEPCGRCVTACPAGAVLNPAVTPDQIHAQVGAILADPPAGTARGIVFTCLRGHGPDPAPDWFAVTVPCAGMVTAGWLLAPLAMGAGAVALQPCSSSGCPLGHDGVVGQVTAFGRAFLTDLEDDPDRLAAFPLPPPPPPLVAVDATTDPFGPTGGAEVLLALAAAVDGDRYVVVDHPAAPVGVVAIDPGACTACGMCAEVCSPGALVHAETATGVSVSFDAALCTACAQCIDRCPELANGAIAMAPRADSHQLRAGRRILHETTVQSCEICGKPVAPSDLLERIGQLLGEEHAGTMDVVSRRCISCRGR